MAVGATTDPDFAEELDAAPPRRGLSGKKIVLIVVPLLLVAAAAGYFLTRDRGPVDQAAVQRAAEAAAASNVVFYDLPDMLVNLSAAGTRPSYLKVAVSLELPDQSVVERLRILEPRVVDQFQIYLRELRTADLRGSAGVARLREELLRRVRAAVEPVPVNDVLFREVLIQ